MEAIFDDFYHFAEGLIGFLFLLAGIAFPTGRNFLPEIGNQVLRAAHRLLKVARTLADLEGSQAIGRAHLAEALQYRPGSS